MAKKKSSWWTTRLVSLLTFFLLVLGGLTDLVSAGLLQENQGGDEQPVSKSVLVGPVITLPEPVQPQGRQDGQRRQGSRFGRNRPGVDNTPLDAAKVRSSIKRGVQYMLENQLDDGSWKKSMGPEGGTTALCTLALINARDDLDDEPYRDPSIKAALNYLSDIPASNTYVVSLRIMAMSAADPKGKVYKRRVQNDVDWLIQTQLDRAGLSAVGAWNYGTQGQGDSSNTQFAILALHEANQMGIKIPRKTWASAQSYWKSCYRPKNGGFSYYSRDAEPRGSMTCAGIASMIITQENLADPADLINGDFANCCSKDPIGNILDNAFKWLAGHYTVRANPYSRREDPRTHLYYLYGLERAGRLSGRRFVGPHDWYRDGARQLLRTQHPLNDYWQTKSGHGENDPLIATSFALLFLAKGKRPIVIGKYDHGAPDWDLHPKGVHALTRRLEKEWGGQKLNWQTVKAENATVDDLLEAPVLFMSGKEIISLDQSQKENLKQYLENGGFLFAEACQGDGCGVNAKFHEAFPVLMKEIFPESKLELLPPNHPIWNSHFPLIGNGGGNKERPLYGLQACCRTSVVYCPANLSCYWNLDRPAIFDNPQISQKLKNRVEYCTKIGVNVVAYATDRANLKEKGDRPKLLQDKSQLLAERALVFPKLRHGGGDDDAPNAWRNVLRNVERLGLEIKMEKKLIQPQDDVLADHPFVFMHGRNAFRLSDEQRLALQKHLEFGGFIFADSICASPAFAESFRSEMNAVLKGMGTQLSSIPPDHKIWVGQPDAYQIRSVTLRTKTPGGKFQEQVKAPELEGAEIDGRLAVVFSPVDLSCALENSAKSQCTGYLHQDALQISTNVLMYSLLTN